MGYTIRIGNANIVSEWPGYSGEPYADWTVELIESPYAPYSIDSGKSNDRAPSYTGWSEFARTTGLHDFFYCKAEGVMRRHPGTFALTKEHAETVESALRLYKEAHPDVEAAFCECHACTGRDGDQSVHNDKADGMLVRLEWLAFWVRWAVDNCERPAIQNT